MKVHTVIYFCVGTAYAFYSPEEPIKSFRSGVLFSVLPRGIVGNSEGDDLGARGASQVSSAKSGQSNALLWRSDPRLRRRASPLWEFPILQARGNALRSGGKGGDGSASRGRSVDPNGASSSRREPGGSQPARGIEKPPDSSRPQANKNTGNQLLKQQSHPPRKSVPNAPPAAWSRYSSQGPSYARVTDKSPHRDHGPDVKLAAGQPGEAEKWSSRQSRASLIPGQGNTHDEHKLSAGGERVNVGLIRNGNNAPIRVRVSGTNYQPIDHTVANHEQEFFRQYRASSPSRPVNVEATFGPGVNGYVEGLRPGATNYDPGSPLHPVHLENA